MAVATMPFNPDVLALFRLTYPSELPYPVRVQQASGCLGGGSGGGGASAAAKTKQLEADDKRPTSVEQERWKATLNSGVWWTPLAACALASYILEEESVSSMALERRTKRAQWLRFTVYL